MRKIKARDNILDIVLDKIKKLIDTEKFDVTLKDVVILITCVTKYGDKFYPQLFL